MKRMSVDGGRSPGGWKPGAGAVSRGQMSGPGPRQGTPSSGQPVPPHTGTGFAVGPTVATPAVNQPSQAAAAGGPDGHADATSVPPPQAYPPAGYSEPGDVSRETEDPPLAQEAERAVKVLNPSGEITMPRPA